MLHHRHQLYMRIAHLFDIIRHHGGKLPVIVKRPTVLRLPPGAKMHLINIHGSFFRILFLSLFHPLLIGPFKFRQIRHYRGRVGTKLSGVGIGIRFQIRKAASGLQLILVKRAWLQTRNKNLKNAGIPQSAHHMAPSIPEIEIAHNTDPHGVRRPYGEVYALHAMNRHRMRAQFFIDIIANPRIEFFRVLLCDLRSKAVGIGIFLLGPRSQRSQHMYRTESSFPESEPKRTLPHLPDP